MEYSINGNFQMRHNGQRLDFVKGKTFITEDKELIKKLDATKEASKATKAK